MKELSKDILRYKNATWSLPFLFATNSFFIPILCNLLGKIIQYNMYMEHHNVDGQVEEYQI